MTHGGQPQPRTLRAVAARCAPSRAITVSCYMYSCRSHPGKSTSRSSSWPAVCSSDHGLRPAGCYRRRVCCDRSLFVRAGPRISSSAIFCRHLCAWPPASRVSSIVRASPVGTRRAGGERRHAVLGTRALLHVDTRDGERSSLGAALLGEEHCLRGRVPRVRGGPAPFWSRREAPGWASSARPPRCLREQESVKE